MKYFTAASTIYLKEDEKGYFTEVVQLDFEVSQDGNRNALESERGVPNKAGAAFMMEALLQGVASCIKHSHASGFIDESENMRKAIDRLQELFVSSPKLEIKDKKNDNR